MAFHLVLEDIGDTTFPSLPLDYILTPTECAEQVCKAIATLKAREEGHFQMCFKEITVRGMARIGPKTFSIDQARKVTAFFTMLPTPSISIEDFMDLCERRLLPEAAIHTNDDLSRFNFVHPEGIIISPDDWRAMLFEMLVPDNGFRIAGEANLVL